MKKLLLIRHSDSPWRQGGKSDHERVLSPQGEEKARHIAQNLWNSEPDLDAIIASTATRAQMTAIFFRDIFGVDPSACHSMDALYLAKPEVILESILNAEDVINTLAVVGHNPGMTDLVNQISDLEVHDLPPCGIVQLIFDVASWNELKGAWPTEAQLIA